MHCLINCMLHPVKNCHYCRGLMPMFPFQSMATSYQRCRNRDFGGKLVGGCSTYYVIALWPDLNWSILHKSCTSGAQLDLRNSARSAGRFGVHFRTNKTKPHGGCVPPVPARVTDCIFRQLHGASFGVVWCGNLVIPYQYELVKEFTLFSSFWDEQKA